MYSIFYQQNEFVPMYCTATYTNHSYKYLGLYAIVKMKSKGSWIFSQKADIRIVKIQCELSQTLMTYNIVSGVKKQLNQACTMLPITLRIYNHKCTPIHTATGLYHWCQNDVPVDSIVLFYL